MMKDGYPVELKTTTIEKDLGIYLDPSLTFSAYCEQQVIKANQPLGLIRRTYTYTYLDDEFFVTLFSVLVRPHLVVSSLQEGFHRA